MDHKQKRYTIRCSQLGLAIDLKGPTLARIALKDEMSEERPDKKRSTCSDIRCSKRCKEYSEIITYCNVGADASSGYIVFIDSKT